MVCTFLDLKQLLLNLNMETLLVLIEPTFDSFPIFSSVNFYPELFCT